MGARVYGGGVRLNFATGETRRLAPEETSLARAEARIAELEHKLRIAQWDAARSKRLAEDVKRNTQNLARSERSRLAAVWRLLDRKRKTVRMDDLRRALGVDVF